MNKKIVILIIVILLSFCFLGIVVADNVAHDNHTTDHGKTVDKDKKVDKNKTDDKNKTPDKNKTDNKTKKNYILAKGSGDDIKFSDGFRGFMLDYSKSPASWGDEFKRVSTSKASDSNTLKLAIIKCYELDSTDEIGDIMADFITTGYSDTEVGEAVEESYETVSDHEVVEIDDDTVAVFDFEVLKSVSGNESDYFAYKVSFRSIYDDEDDLNLTNNLTNVTNMTNITGLTNITNMTIDNETNATFLKELYDFLLFLADMLYEAWKPIIDTIIGYFMMFIQAMEELVKMYEQLMAEIQSLMDALEQLLNMLESIWKELDGLLKLIGILLTALQQLLNFIESLLNFILSIISQLIALLQQLLALLYSLINFLLDLLNQIASLLQAIFDFLKSVGSFLINVIENAAVIIIAFVIITIGAFIYNRIR